MPLPIAHVMIGATIAALFHPRTSLKNDRFVLLLGAILAIVPDFDFFFVWVLGFGREWHRGFTHSISFALFSALTMLLLGASFFRVKTILAWATSLLSHSILDYLTSNEGGGVQLLFPFSHERFKFGMGSLFETGPGSYWYEIAKSCVIEAVIFVPMLIIILLIREYIANKPRGKTTFEQA